MNKLNLKKVLSYIKSKYRLAMIYITLKGIDRRNALFYILTPEQKRIAIAKDVIHQINAERLQPRGGNYVCDNMTLLNIQERAIAGEDIQRMLIKEDPECIACGLGSVLLSAIRIGNNFHDDIINGANSSRISKHLSAYFEQEQLAMIEAAFEGTVYVSRGELGWDDLEEVSKFRNEYPDPAERLRAIMNNIINNNGTFIPC